ncbi:hypothetical protein B0O99DRAFT_681015 [Bisporella sp. PMI_857]|nr:hypothetical protein B0O99DRAFT_681015 [Bisporella sp. PMI_857]
MTLKNLFRELQDHVSAGDGRLNGLVSLTRARYARKQRNALLHRNSSHNKSTKFQGATIEAIDSLWREAWSMYEALDPNSCEEDARTKIDVVAEAEPETGSEEIIESSFHKFTELPTELRLTIWNEITPSNRLIDAWSKPAYPTLRDNTAEVGKVQEKETTRGDKAFQFILTCKEAYTEVSKNHRLRFGGVSEMPKWFSAKNDILWFASYMDLRPFMEDTQPYNPRLDDGTSGVITRIAVTVHYISNSLRASKGCVGADCGIHMFLHSQPNIFSFSRSMLAALRHFKTLKEVILIIPEGCQHGDDCKRGATTGLRKEYDVLANWWKAVNVAPKFGFPEYHCMTIGELKSSYGLA